MCWAVQIMMLFDLANGNCGAGTNNCGACIGATSDSYTSSCAYCPTNGVCSSSTFATCPEIEGARGSDNSWISDVNECQAVRTRSCSNGVCTCDHGYSGDTCEILPRAYRVEGYDSTFIDGIYLRDSSGPTQVIRPWSDASLGNYPTYRRIVGNGYRATDGSGNRIATSLEYDDYGAPASEDTETRIFGVCYEDGNNHLGIWQFMVNGNLAIRSGIPEENCGLIANTKCSRDRITCCDCVSTPTPDQPYGACLTLGCPLEVGGTPMFVSTSWERNHDVWIDGHHGDCDCGNLLPLESCEFCLIYRGRSSTPLPTIIGIPCSSDLECCQVAGVQCSEHGTITLSNATGFLECTCVCSSENYSGDTCQNFDPCYGIECGSHGHCSNGRCDCDDPAYSGDTCQNFDPCYGIECGSHGHCSNGRCDCDDPAYSGDTCQNFDPCYGIECGSHGHCSNGRCDCGDPAYSGDTCQNFDPCYGIECGSHGHCSNGRCDCDD
eukprot:COSAG06_NODE_9276_length_1941_cov_3.328990_1_plen_492_part_10